MYMCVAVARAIRGARGSESGENMQDLMYRVQATPSPSECFPSRDGLPCENEYGRLESEVDKKCYSAGHCSLPLHADYVYVWPNKSIHNGSTCLFTLVIQQANV